MKTKIKKSRNIFSFDMPLELSNRVNDFCEISGEKRSSFVRRLICNELNKSSLHNIDSTKDNLKITKSYVDAKLVNFHMPLTLIKRCHDYCADKLFNRTTLINHLLDIHLTNNGI